MNYKFSLKSNFKKHFPVYVFFCALIPTVVGVSLNAKNELKRIQIISIFIASNGVKNQNELMRQMVEITSVNSIRKANVNYANPYSESFQSQYTTVGLKSSDIVLLPKSVIEDPSLSYVYNEIPETNKYYSLSNYIYNEMHYGICVHSNELSYLDDYVAYGDDEYYLFLPVTSPHLLEFAEKSSTNSVYLLLEGLLK